MLNAGLLQSTMAKLSLTAVRMDQEKGEKLRKHDLFSLSQENRLG